ncbi:MAG: FecCD family ABC transporter permease [Peptococcaceae bacterium]
MDTKFLQILQKKYFIARMAGMCLFFLMLLTIMLSVMLGRADIGVESVLKIILAKASGKEIFLNGITQAQEAIVWSIRLPRILTAVLVGSGLAVAGAVFQSLLMNPLADSYTMGVSTGAAFGAVLGIYLNLFSDSVQLPITLCAFSGSFLTLLLVVSIAKVKGYLNSANLIIAGIIVSSILSAAISFLKSASGEQVAAIVYWLMGSLAARSWDHVLLGFPLILSGILICTYYAEDLNIMCLGDHEARALGIDVQKLRMIFLITGSLITAVCVSVSGIIGFIGLIVPHMLRFIIGSDNRMLIPLSALCGGELLLLADTGTRALLNIELPVGVITTLLGGPFFIYIFITRNKTLHQ